MFCQLEYQKPRWQSFVASYLLMAGFITLAVVVTILTAPNLMRVAYDKIELVAPPLSQPKQYEPPKPKIAKVIPPVAPSKELLAKIEPKIIVPQVVLPKKVEVAEVAPPKVMPVKFDSPLDKMPGPKVVKAVETNVLGSSAAPTLPPTTRSEKVQTGGFGDPNGVTANASAQRSRMGVANTGSFDLPTGAGTGNGTGGANGKQGTIASAGFGNGVATGQGGGGRGFAGAQIQNTSFGSATPVAEAPTRTRRMEEVAPLTPVSVTSKPNPAYTEEARKQHVEGEVLVQVVFMASGQVQVVRVVRGLGYGLDESAVQAAQRVRFVPAQRNGQPVDSTATLHIVFQLS